MYAYYKGHLLSAHYVGKKIRIGSSIKYEGFEPYTDVVGRVHYDHFVREVTDVDLDYLYDLSYQVKYKGRYFILFTALNPPAIEEDYYEVILRFLDPEEKQLAEA